MKTIIRIGDTIEGIDQIRSEKLGAFGVKQLVDAFAKRRSDFVEGLMIVENGQSDDRPVFVVLSSRPPQIITGQREVHAVFWPPDSQEPVATFGEEADAHGWAAGKYGQHDQEPDYIIRPIDSTDKIGVQVSLATMVWRGDEMLFCRIKNTRQWTLPEGYLGIGESTAAAAERSVLEGCGVGVANVHIPGRVPYINTYLRRAGQHFLTVVMYAEYKDGEAQPLEEVYDEVGWFPAKKPPKPLFGLVTGVIRVLSKYDDPAEATAEAP